MTFSSNLILRHLLIAILLIGISTSFNSIAYASGPSCQSLLNEHTDLQKRLEIARQRPQLELTEILFQLKKEQKLLYQGRHKYEPGTEFLASNEFDWLTTPFDHKPSDVLIAFGTNSAWEIAVNKNVKTLYLADWSPYPLIASAYIISPLIRIAKNPKELIVLLSGRVPTAELTVENLDTTFESSRRYLNMRTNNKSNDARELLEYLANKNISEFELKFLASYFYGLVDYSTNSNGIGPFEKLRYASFAKLLNFYDQRYSPSVVSINNPETLHSNLLDQFSVFSSQKNFEKLKTLFVSDQIKYGLTEITDIKFYEAVRQQEDSFSNRSYALSITNIFDCGDYNRLNMNDFRRYLMQTLKLFKADKNNPLVVFRTTNAQPPPWVSPL